MPNNRPEVQQNAAAELTYANRTESTWFRVQLTVRLFYGWSARDVGGGSARRGRPRARLGPSGLRGDGEPPGEVKRAELRGGGSVQTQHEEPVQVSAAQETSRNENGNKHFCCFS